MGYTVRNVEAVRPRTNKTLVMGIMNITPDSFYDGGLWATPEAARRHAERLTAEGADILDVGGESTRPGARPLPPGEEMARVMPVIERVADLGVPLSIDTYHAETARAALEAGAAMINDITAFRGDPEMAEVAAGAGCACVLMHMQGTPETMQRAPRYADLVGDIMAFFEERTAFAEKAGVRRENIWLDPGFGFGKTPSQNLEMLRRLREFTTLGFPILIGVSNKSTIGLVLDAPVNDRREGTAAACAIAIANGAAAIRVHDVGAMAKVAKMTDAIMGRGEYDR